MLRHCERLEGLVDDLLELSRVERGRAVPTVSAVDLVALLRTACDVARRRGQAVEVLGPDRPVVVRADPAMLRAILERVLSEAVRRSPPDATLCVRVTAGADEAVLTLSDRAGAAPASKLATMLGRTFEEGEGGCERRGGGGLDLFVATRFVEAMGGRLTAGSDAGGGWRCSIALSTEGPVGFACPDEEQLRSAAPR